MRERVMTPETAFIENGHLVIRDRAGIARWTSNPADSDANREAGRGFNINNMRLANVERLIQHRYGGPVDTDDAEAYLSAAFNAIAMGRRLRGWKQSAGPLLAWARQWTPTGQGSEADTSAGAYPPRPPPAYGRTGDRGDGKAGAKQTRRRR